ncbi:hypothetical protein E2C01_095714 [Portunus trituberculatus]|uniref:Uncharacterized protein n=1 Tax=Portunus trituberculatus TaxID=210409 RepID=A0A5B7K0V5_PORTR|nr:hypothetical protein [Portunus trituberculatus]
MEVLQSSLGSLRVQAQDYTDHSCESVRSELEQNLQAVKGDLQTVKDELEKDLQALWDEVRDIRSETVWRQPDMATRGVSGALGVSLLPLLMPWAGTVALLEQRARGGLLVAHQRPRGLWETRVCWRQVSRHLSSLPCPAWRARCLCHLHPHHFARLSPTSSLTSPPSTTVR